MLWQYSRRDTKVLLIATLSVFSGYAVLLGQSWTEVITQSRDLSATTIGVYAGVDENEVNTYVSELDQRARELELREAALASRSAGVDPKTLLAVSVGGGGLLALILLNFYLDHKRRLTFS